VSGGEALDFLDFEGAPTVIVAVDSPCPVLANVKSKRTAGADAGELEAAEGITTEFGKILVGVFPLVLAAFEVSPREVEEKDDGKETES